MSHDMPLFADGISGAEILWRQRGQVVRYGGWMMAGDITHLVRVEGGFRAAIHPPHGDHPRSIGARHVLLATAAEDIELDLPDLRACAATHDVARHGCGKIPVPFVFIAVP
jgi:thioredoxin reductase (NADPH)